MSYIKTILKSSPIQFLNDIKSIDNNYDLVITDFDPISAYAAKKYKIRSSIINFWNNWVNSGVQISNEYPLYNIEISNKSHPFFTGQQNLVDTAGRIEKFQKKYNRK